MHDKCLIISGFENGYKGRESSLTSDKSTERLLVGRSVFLLEIRLEGK